MKHLLTTIAVVVLIVLGINVNARGDDQITWKSSGTEGAVAAGEADSVVAGIRLLEVDSFFFVGWAKNGEPLFFNF